MQPSADILTGLATFYERFSAHDPDGFADILATGAGVLVIGTAPGEGHDRRDDWIATYRQFIGQTGLRLQGCPEPRGFAEGPVGFVVDTPRFVLPDGSFIPTWLTAFLRQESRAWKVVHLHFSVGVPDDKPSTNQPARSPHEDPRHRRALVPVAVGDIDATHGP